MSLSEPTADGAFNEEAERLIGEVLSERYRIDQVLGLGGMGAVYRAEHLLMHKVVAIKVLHAEMTRMPEVVARFEREAMAAAHIEHPNVASATDFGKLANGSFFLVLEYVEGKNLRDEIEKGPMAEDRAIHITRQVLFALHRAHGLGIVHRDLKPENVMLVDRDGDTDFVKVLDFGIAKVPLGDLQTSGSAPDRKPLTQLGMVYGTPEYMAPEQALGQEVDARADLYALGVLLFEMLTSKRPFDAASAVQILGMVVAMPVPEMVKVAPDVAVSPPLEAFTRKLLEKLPADRFVDARAAVEALDEAAGVSGAQPLSSYGGARSMGRQMGSRASIASIGTMPTSVQGEAVVVAGAPGKLPRNVLVLGAAAVGVALLLVIVLVVALRGPSTEQSARMADSPSSSPSDSAKPANTNVSPGVTDADLRNATAQGVSALDALREKYPRDPRVLRALATADIEQKHGANAAIALTTLLDVDRSAMDDKSVREAILATAQLDAGTEGAFALMLNKDIGQAGPDLLFELTRAKGVPPKVQKRASEALFTDPVLAAASPALRVALDLRNSGKLAPAEQCKTRRQLFVTAKDAGDSRALPFLRQWQDTRGCGFLHRGDCFACLHVDGALGDAISAIMARDKKPD